MTCLECKQKLSYNTHKLAIETFGLELCEKHRSRLLKLIASNGTPLEAIKLYYGLKSVGIMPMLEWWDGKRFVHLAVSRVKLNIEIDTAYEMLTPEKALTDLEDAMCSYKNGFTTIRIPHVLIKYRLNETVDNINNIIESLKVRVKVV